MLAHLMRHTAQLWRPVFAQAAGQEIDRYSLAYVDVPCFAQPASSRAIIAYQQWGIEIDTIIYTNDTTRTFKQNDLLVVAGRQYHVASTKNALLSDLYFELACLEYPEGAKKRLDKEEFDG